MPESRVESGPRSLWAAAGVSVLLHLAAGLAIVSPWTQTASPEPTSAQIEPIVPIKPNVPRLGIERSKAVTVTWVGFEAPTEHQAPMSEVEQAMLSPAAGVSPLAAAEPSPPAPPAEPSPPTPAAEPSAPAPQPQPSPAPSLPPEVLAPVAIAPPAPSPTANQQPAPTSTPPEPPTEPQQAQPPTPSESASGSPGIEDDRESDAAALKKPLEYKPGKPIAAEGIEITTVRPSFGTTVKLLANPDNPLVIIDFGPDGHVRRARFARDTLRTLNTGNPYVDGAILDAIYRWTAKGKAIDELGKDQTLTYSIRLLLRG